MEEVKIQSGPLVFKETRQKPTPDGQGAESFEISEIEVLGRDSFVITFYDDKDVIGQYVEMALALHALLENENSLEGEAKKVLGSLHNIPNTNKVFFEKCDMRICMGLLVSASFISHHLAGEVLSDAKFQALCAQKEPEERKIPFLISGDRGFSQIDFGNKDLTIITKGRVEEPVKGTLMKIIKELRNIKKFDGKMCSVYLIEEGEKYTWYVSISGDAVPEMTYRQARQKLKVLGQDIVLISSSLERKAITEEAEEEDPGEDNYEDLNRKDLFKRFLVAAVSDYDGNDKKRYPELKRRFLLSDQHDLAVKAVKATSKREDIKEIAKIKSTELQREITVLDLFCDNIFYPKKLGAKQFDVIAKGGWTGTLLNVDLTTEKINIKPYIDLHRQDLLKVMSEAELDEMYQHIENLWDYLLERFSNFKVSQLLSHCSESNLIDYFHDNQKILSSPGEHYLFSFLLTEKNAQEPEIHDLCDICQINAVGHFSYFQQKLGKSGKREIHAAIPILVEEEIDAVVGNAPHSEFFPPASPTAKPPKVSKPLHRAPSTELQRRLWEKEDEEAAEESSGKKAASTFGKSCGK